MWVEVEHDDVATSFKPHDRIRVDCGEEGGTFEGYFLEVRGNGGHPNDRCVRLDRTGELADHALTLYLWPSRTFYKWVEDQPTDSVNQLDVHVDHSRLRLNKPPEFKCEHGAKVVDCAVERTRCDVKVGRHTYVLEPGDHLRVWWEDGALWSELVQERTK